MKTQRDIARQAGIRDATLSDLVRGRIKCSWKTAKKLSVITGIEPAFWMDGTTDEIRRAIDRARMEE